MYMRGCNQQMAIVGLGLLENIVPFNQSNRTSDNLPFLIIYVRHMNTST